MLDSLNINIVTKSALLSDTYPLIASVLPFNVEPIVFAICVPCNRLAKARFFWILFQFHEGLLVGPDSIIAHAMVSKSYLLTLLCRELVFCLQSESLRRI